MQHHLFDKETLMEKFGWEEYVVFCLMLVVSAAIGVYFWWRGQNSNHEFLLGGKSMGVFPMTMSLFASFISAIALLGVPSEMYVYGTQYFLIVLSYPLVAAATANLYLPVFYKLQVSTSYEYLEWRFNKAVRVLASACFTLHMVFYMAIVVYAPALALSQITGFDVDTACAIMFVVCIFYTAIGGIKAVMWTDAFQATVMFGSILAVIIKGSYDAGGPSRVFNLNYQTERVELFNFDPSMTTRHTVWGVVIGGYFIGLSILGINQASVQRYLSTPTMEKAVKGIWFNCLAKLAFYLMCLYAGMVLFAYYYDAQCDPIKAKLIAKRDQLFPLFVMQVMGDIPCIPGLFVAGIFSGALSTISSGLNSLAAVTLQDFIKTAGGMELSERASLWTSKGLAIAYGLLSYGLVFLIKYLPGVLQASLAIAGITGGPVLGAFSLGMFLPWANSIGTFVGMLSSLAFTAWIGCGQVMAQQYGMFSVKGKETTVEGCPAEWMEELSHKMSLVSNATVKVEPDFTYLSIYEVSYIWYTPISCMLCMVVGIIISFMTKPQDPRTLNPDLISPGLKRLFCFWPRVVRNFVIFPNVGSQYNRSSKEDMLMSRQIMQDPDEKLDKTAKK